VDPKDRAVPRRFVRKAESRKIGHDNVERILGPSAEGFRVGEQRDDLRETIKTSRGSRASG
jgi:hypothetical protein